MNSSSRDIRPDKLLRQARSRLTAGNARDAERIARDVLEMQPRSAEAWEIVGDVRLAEHRVQEAVDAFAAALRNRPELGFLRTKLGVALIAMGQRQSAEKELRHAVKDDPEHAPAQMNLGTLLAESGRSEEAEACLRKAVELVPDYPEALRNLGNILNSQSRWREAIRAFEKAVSRRPTDAESLTGLAMALAEVQRAGTATVLLRQASRLRPRSPDALNKLGVALCRVGRFKDAERYLQRALDLSPDFPAAHLNLGMAYVGLNQPDEAIACFDLSLLLHPDQSLAHWNRALTLLQLGDYEHGWAEYDWRLKQPHSTRIDTEIPLWNGSPLEGKTILIHAEQGLGDVIQFVRYASELKEKSGAGKVLVHCPSPLVGIISTCSGIDQVVPEGAEIPLYDTHLPLLSLPSRMKTTLTSLPANTPYLFAEPDRVEHWRIKMSDISGSRIGIVWQGNRFHKWDNFRSVRLELFDYIARVKGVQLISLQRIFGKEQMSIWGRQMGLIDIAPDAGDTAEDFADTAAIIQNLDMVITVDTAVAHLAGALGKPVWIALGHPSDWRWMLERADSPWYPTMRLYRKEKSGDWHSVFKRMARDLSSFGLKSSGYFRQGEGD